MAPQDSAGNTFEVVLPFVKESPWWSQEVDSAFQVHESIESFLQGLVPDVVLAVQSFSQSTNILRRLSAHLSSHTTKGALEQAAGDEFGAALGQQLVSLAAATTGVASAQEGLAEAWEAALLQPLKCCQRQQRRQRLADLRKQMADSQQAHELALDHQLNGSSSLPFRCTAEVAGEAARAAARTFASAELFRQELSAAVNSACAASVMEVSSQCAAALVGLQAYCDGCCAAGGEMERSVREAQQWQTRMRDCMTTHAEGLKGQKSTVSKLCKPFLPLGCQTPSAGDLLQEDSPGACELDLHRSDALDSEDEQQRLLPNVPTLSRAVQVLRTAGKQQRRRHQVVTRDTDQDLGHLQASLESVYARRNGTAAHEGYLWRRLPASSTGRRPWVRNWFYVDKSCLYFTQKSVGGKMEPVYVCDCQLVAVRPLQETEGLRFAFEVLLPSGRPHVLQAESEQAFTGWLAALRSAILDALQLSSSSLSGESCKRNDLEETQGNRVGAILKANATCADCGTEDPDWVTLTFGTLLCIDCAAVHRGLGAHLSKVRSLKLDVLSASEFAGVEAVGNETANAELEAKVPPGYFKPSPKASRATREQWIQAKYVTKSFAAGRAPEEAQVAVAHPASTREVGRATACGDLLGRLAAFICEHRPLSSASVTKP